MLSRTADHLFYIDKVIHVTKQSNDERIVDTHLKRR